MTDQASRVSSDVDNARTVETALYALQDQDFDTLDSACADEIVWQNTKGTLRGLAATVFPSLRQTPLTINEDC